MFDVLLHILYNFWISCQKTRLIFFNHKFFPVGSSFNLCHFWTFLLGRYGFTEEDNKPTPPSLLLVRLMESHAWILQWHRGHSHWHQCSWSPHFVWSQIQLYNVHKTIYTFWLITKTFSLQFPVVITFLTPLKTLNIKKRAEGAKPFSLPMKTGIKTTWVTWIHIVFTYTSLGIHYIQPIVQ